MHRLRTVGHQPRTERMVLAYSRLGEHGAGWVVLGLALDCRRGALAVIRAYAANQALKVVVRRRRPDLPGLPALVRTRSTLSFPSAHATTSFAALRAYRHDAPRGLLALAATAMALSRVYLGVHWPSDVLAGAALGAAITP